MERSSIQTTSPADVTVAINDLLNAYAAALNASSTAAVMPLYADDGVFMDCFSPSAIGSDAIRKEYDKVFKAITLHVKFEVAEVVVTGPEWAFARTNSAGTVSDRASGASHAEGNQELFVFHKQADGAWKIARYCFSPTRPPTMP